MRRWKCVILAGTLALGLVLGGCVRTEENPDLEDIVINLYDPVSGYVGVQGGWYGHILEKMFHVTLNFLDTAQEGAFEEADLLILNREAPIFEEADSGLAVGSEGVGGESASGSGKAGDLLSGNPTMRDLLGEWVESGAFLDLEPYLQDLEIWQYESQLRYWNEDLAEDGVYVIPSEISRMSAETPTEEDLPHYGIYIQWQTYGEAGYPRIRNQEELRKVLSWMQKVAVEAGRTDWVGCALYREEGDDILDQLARIIGAYGYETLGFVMYRQNDRSTVGLLEDGLLGSDGVLEHAVKWLWNANQLGLLDPASPRQSRQEVLRKYGQGLVGAHMEPGLGIEGYELAPLEDMEVVSYGGNPKGTLETVVAVRAGTPYPERAAELINWLYSAEGIMDGGTHTGAHTAGPIGLTWQVQEGEPVLTEFGERVLQGQEDLVLSDEWGGGTWQEGYSRLSLRPVLSVEVSPSGFLYNYKMWNSVARRTDELWTDWCQRLQAVDAMEYLVDHGNLSVIPAYIAPDGEKYRDTEEIAALRASCKEAIEESLWNIIFCQTEQEYKELWAKMVMEAEEQGYEEILRFDEQRAENLRKEREMAAR